MALQVKNVARLSQSERKAIAQRAEELGEELGAGVTVSG
jgi:hypothetical protein